MTILTAEQLAEIAAADARNYSEHYRDTSDCYRHRRALLRHIDALSALSPSAPGVESQPTSADIGKAAQEACLGAREYHAAFRNGFRSGANWMYDRAWPPRSRLAAPAGDGWIEWKDGDAMPPDGMYWTTREYHNGSRCVMETEVAGAHVRGWWPTQYTWRVVAYMPSTKPEVYAPPSGAKGE